MENKTKKKCDRCDKPAEAEKYRYCYDCWWEQDPRNQTPKTKSNGVKDTATQQENAK